MSFQWGPRHAERMEKLDEVAPRQPAETEEVSAGEVVGRGSDPLPQWLRERGNGAGNGDGGAAGDDDDDGGEEDVEAWDEAQHSFEMDGAAAAAARALSLRERGNEAFRRGALEEAVALYGAGITELSGIAYARLSAAATGLPQGTAASPGAEMGGLPQLLANRAAALCKNGQLEDALRDARAAASMAPRYAKAHFRLGSVLVAMDEAARREAAAAAAAGATGGGGGGGGSGGGDSPRAAEAVAAFDAALALTPADAACAKARAKAARRALAHDKALSGGADATPAPRAAATTPAAAAAAAAAAATPVVKETKGSSSSSSGGGKSGGSSGSGAGRLYADKPDAQPAFSWGSTEQPSEPPAAPPTAAAAQSSPSSSSPAALAGGSAGGGGGGGGGTLMLSDTVDGWRGAAGLPGDDEATWEPIVKFAFSDNQGKVKAYVDLRGAGTMPRNRITCTFGIKSLDLRIRGYAPPGPVTSFKNLQLQCLELWDEIDPPKCKLAVKEDKLVITLVKGARANDRPWEKLRC